MYPDQMPLSVPRGERGPRAVALQILLNRRRAGGRVLRVDGFFGPKTSQAVEAYRSEVLRMGGPPETADPPLWDSLLRGTNLVVADSVDVTDPAVGQEDLPSLRQHGNPIVISDTGNGVGQVLSEIRRRASRGPLLLVRFHGHGSAGVMAVSHGTPRLNRGINPFEHRTVISRETVQAMRGEFAALAPLMCNFGFFEFHGCRVGGSRELLRTLAEIWRSPVSAGRGAQQGGASVYTFEGTVETQYPANGNLPSWAASRTEAQGIQPAP